MLYALFDLTIGWIWAHSVCRVVFYVVCVVWVIGWLVVLHESQYEVEGWIDHSTGKYKSYTHDRKLTEQDFIKAVLWPFTFLRMFFWAVVIMIMAVVGPIVCIPSSVMWQESKFKKYLDRKFDGK